jgi:hypothetical protein
MAWAMERTQVEHQHAQREQVEENPEYEQLASQGGLGKLLISDC